MQKWWLKLKLPIEHEQERVYRRKAEKERQEREIRRIWNRHVFAGEKSIPIEIPSFRLFVDRFGNAGLHKQDIDFDMINI